jgi:hypothetical protein
MISPGERAPSPAACRAHKIVMDANLVIPDSVRPAHIPEFYELLGGGKRDARWDGSARPAARLAILPGHIRTNVFAAPELSHRGYPVPGCHNSCPDPDVVSASQALLTITTVDGTFALHYRLGPPTRSLGVQFAASPSASIGPD